MIELKSCVRTGQRIAPPRIVIFGPEGIGKTTFAASCPNPVFIKTEEGSGMLDFARITFENSWDKNQTGKEQKERREVAEELLEVNDALYALAEEPHDFQTLVIDSITGLEKLLQKDLCESNNEKDIHGTSPGSKFAFERGYKLEAEKLDHFLQALTYLSEKRSMMIVLVAHSSIAKFKSPDTEDFEYYELALEKKYSAEVLKKWADAIFFANFERPLLSTEKEFGKTKAKAKVQQGELARLLFTEKRPSHTAKNRWNLPYEIKLERTGGWDIIADHLATAFEAGETKKPKAKK